jgi:single-strand DNA-binding protein
VTSFSIATNRRWNNQDGSKGEETVWFRVAVWRKQAETAAKYLKKGRQVMIEGRMTPDKATGGPRVWTGQDGMVRSSYEVTADRIIFLGGRQDSDGEQVKEGPVQQTSSEPVSSSLEDDDLPF